MAMWLQPLLKENPTKKYAKFLHEKTGVMDNTKIRDFTETQFEGLCKAIQQMERYRPGEVVEVFCIHAVQVTNKRINRFCLHENNWISVSECISLSKQCKVELEACASHMGNDFLRSPPHSAFQAKLETLIQK